MTIRNDTGAAQSVFVLLAVAIAAILVVVTAFYLFSSPPGADKTLESSDGTSGEGGVFDPQSGDEGSGDEDARLLKLAAGSAVPVAGSLSLDRTALTNVTVQAFNDFKEPIPPSIARVLRSTPLTSRPDGAELKQLLDDYQPRPMDPVADCATDKEGAFAFNLVPSETLLFSLDHDFFFLPREQAGPFKWTEDNGRTVLDSFDGRLEARLGSMIRGRVIDPDGAPLEGVEIELLPSSSESQRNRGFPFAATGDADSMARVVFTDADGVFMLRGVSPGQDLALNANAPGWAPARSELFESIPGQVQSIDLQLRQGTALKVAVQDPDGNPLEDADLFLDQEAGLGAAAGSTLFEQFRRIAGSLVIQSAKTGPEGEHVFTALGPGEYKVRAAFPGMMEAATEKTLMVTEKDLQLAVELGFDWGLAISGTVIDEQGQPVADVTVEASPHFGRGGVYFAAMRHAITAPESARKMGVTDAAGRFRITGLKPESSYNLRSEGPGYIPAIKNDVKAGQETITLIMENPGVIQGRVIAAVTARPVTTFKVLTVPVLEGWDSGRRGGPLDAMTRAGRRPGQNRGERFSPFQTESGGPLERVTETVFNSVRQSFRTGMDQAVRMTEREDPVSHSEGRFSLHDILPGRYRLCIAATGYAPGVTAVIEIQKGSSVQDIVVALEPGASISGRVDNPFGPLSKALVEINADSQEDRELELAMASIDVVETDSSGAFRLANLPAGEFTLLASHSDHPDASTKLLPLATGQAMQGIVITLPAGAIVQGTALDEQGIPLPSQSVLCRSSVGWSGTKRDRTDDNGRFAFKGLAEGSYRISLMTGRSSLFSRSQGPDSTTVEVIEGDVQEIVLQEAALEGATVQGVVMDGLTPLDNGFMTVSPKDGRQTRTAAINRDGSYSVEGVLPGTNRFNIRFDSGGHSERVVQSFDIPDQQTVILNIDLPTGAMSGVVLDAASGLPLEDVRLDLRPESSGGESPWSRWGSTKSAYSDEEGLFHFRKLTGGAYSLQASPPRSLAGPLGTGYCTTSIENVVLPEEGRLDGIKVLLATGGAIRVIVMDTNGDTIRGALVTVSRSTQDGPGNVSGGRNMFSGQGNRGQTDEQGEVLLKGLDPGPYSVSIQAPQMAEFIKDNVLVREGRFQEVNVTVRKGVEISVRLSDEGNQPIANARLILRDSRGQRLNISGGRGRMAPIGQVGEEEDQNLYPLGLLLPGAYTLEARWQGRSGSASFSVGGPGEISLVIKTL